MAPRKKATKKGSPKKAGAAKAPRHRKFLRDNIQGITKPALRRILLKAAVRRVENPVYDELRALLFNHVQKIVAAGLTNMQGARRKTLTVRDAARGIEAACGVKMAAGDKPKAKSCKVKSKSKK
jgi:histone H4